MRPKFVIVTPKKVIFDKIRERYLLLHTIKNVIESFEFIDQFES
jgi:hypothetical protein